jgi:hypothetical protein
MVSTTGFSTQRFKRAAAKVWANLRADLYAGFFHVVGRGWAAFFLGLALLPGVAQATPTDVTEWRVERTEDGVNLSAVMRFELPPVIEDALLKGIPLYFVAEADVYRERWYWTDPRIASAARTIRLAYQPLTRRWRVNVAPGIINNSAGMRATFNQNYDSLSDAMSAVQRLTRWKIAENADIAPDSAYRLEFSFRLDLSQLPRPFQIGVAGQSDWSIAAQARERLKLETLPPPAAR